MSPLTEKVGGNSFEGRVVVSGIIGGTTSKIAGGKFANGAATGAFVYGFNHWEHISNFIQESNSWFNETMEKVSTYMRGQFLEDSGYNQMARVGNGVINIYDKFTTGFSKMMLNAPTAVVYPVETIETIEIVNDIFNPSTPASTSKGQGINIIRGLICE